MQYTHLGRTGLKVSWLALAACLPGISLAASSTSGASSMLTQESPVKIRLHVDGQVATATLHDNATARDFAALLPMSLTLTDFARIERIADLPRKLSLDRTETTVPVKEGDLAYYVPWGNLAIFVEDGTGNYTGDLMRLGAVDTGLPALQRPGPLQIRIERIAN